jgi:hypothetical protein
MDKENLVYLHNGVLFKTMFSLTCGIKGRDKDRKVIGKILGM